MLELGFSIVQNQKLRNLMLYNADHKNGKGAYMCGFSYAFQILYKISEGYTWEVVGSLPFDLTFKIV